MRCHQYQLDLGRRSGRIISVKTGSNLGIWCKSGGLRASGAFLLFPLCCRIGLGSRRGFGIERWSFGGRDFEGLGLDSKGLDSAEMDNFGKGGRGGTSRPCRDDLPDRENVIDLELLREIER